MTPHSGGSDHHFARGLCVAVLGDSCSHVGEWYVRLFEIGSDRMRSLMTRVGG